ncbi:MAG: saccharopine dehydrogenase NADP-binding domain-containing protein [Pseudomonadota bacterium]
MYDVVLFGATGFTGRLVAEYLLAEYGEGQELSWAIAGRSADRLARIADELGAADIPQVVADSGSERDLVALAQSTRVVCTTVGPYAMYGSALVKACAEAGTHYCDLTGEVPWMREMIGRHSAAAEASGARIVHTCGFDSIPSDLGTLFLQNAMMAEHGVAAQSVKYRAAGFSGGFSGGTVASLVNVLENASKDEQLRRVLEDPYALLPAGSPRGQDVNDQTTALYDEDFERWTLPFVMAGINTRVVRRSNALLNFPWGQNFRYDEATLAGANVGALAAKAMAFAMTAGTASLSVAPLRALARRALPAPGEGPSAAQREAGYFDIYLYGAHPNNPEQDLLARVTGDRDPGYGSTSKMLGESAVCLARDELHCAGGFWTPASAMGKALIERLENNAGLTFTLEDTLP